VLAQGPAKLRSQMPLLLEDAEQKITPRMRSLLAQLWQEWKSLNSEIECVSDEIDASAGRDAACQRLRQTRKWGRWWTATVAGIGNGAAFRKGREFAAWLGLIPRQHSTGGKARLLGISKRGNIYLRRMFIHGAEIMKR
jgi:transposase